MLTTRSQRRRTAVGALAATALLLAACGGGSSDDAVDVAAGTDPATATEPDGTLAEDAGGDDAATAPEAPETSGGETSRGEATADGGDPDVADPSSADAPAEDGAVATSTRYDDGGVDLVGTEVGAASTVETNPFPDLVVDDLNRGKQVNLRNVVPGERPILLWFWAPH